MEHQKDNSQNRSNSTGHEPKAFHGYGYIVRKAEKLTTALYIVTDILPDREPMKWKTREVGVEVLSDITVAAATTSSEKMSMLRVVLKKIEKLVSFLDVATSTHLVSEMNASMLRKEYLALKDGVEAEWSRMQERSKTILSERFFEVPHDAPALEEPAVREERRFTPSVQPVRPSEHKGDFSQNQGDSSAQSKGHSLALEGVTLAPPRIHTAPPADATSFPTQQTPVVSPRAPSIPTPQPERTWTPPRLVISDRDVIARSRPDVTRDDRRKIILALIKQKPAITVGDIAKSIPGISEKTIQRELLSMVEEGTLVKKGERRWSTYSLREG